MRRLIETGNGPVSRIRQGTSGHRLAARARTRFPLPKCRDAPNLRGIISRDGRRPPLLGVSASTGERPPPNATTPDGGLLFTILRSWRTRLQQVR